MKEVKLLHTAQIRLFPQDAIPLSKLIMEKHRDSIKSLYSFQTLEPLVRGDLTTGVSFNNGTYGAESVVIEAVTIEGRRIVVRVLGSSEVANAVYEGVAKKLEELNDGRRINELLCTHETASSIVLDVPFERIFSSAFLTFLNKSASKYTTNKWSRNLILPDTLKFSVRYMLTDEMLIKNHITLAPKELVIEPRSQSSPEERLYWIASPMDTETHFKLIEDLEKALAEK